MNPLESALLYVTAATVLLVVLAVLMQRRANRQYQHRLCTGLVWLALFRQLLNLLQQHRGLSNGVLCGDSELKKRIAPLQHEIDALFERLDKQDRWLATNDNWRAIASHWRSLEQGFENLTAANSLSQHTKLIASMLYLIDDCSEHHQLYEVKDGKKQSIRYLWRETLMAAEWIGQARALGTGVAASGRSSSVERIRLKYLHQAITANQQKLGERSQAKLGSMLKIIESQLMQPVTSVSASEYFDLASGALSDVYQTFDEQLVQLKRQPRFAQVSFG